MVEPSGYTAPSSRVPKEPLLVAALIVFVSVALAVGGIVFKTRDTIQRDKVEFLADANQKQVAPLRRVIQLRLAQDKARLIQFAATRSALGPGRARVFGDFALISLVVPGGGGQWGLSWIEKGPLYPQLQSGQTMLTPNQELALLKSLPYDRIREGDVHWQRLSDSGGRPVWALAVSVETQNSPTTPGNPSARTLPEGTDYQSVQVGTGGRAVVVGFFGRNPLLSATEDFIGSTSTAFVIDSRGYAATHSNKTMVGSLLKDDPSVKEVFSARSSAGATRYQSPQGARVFSAFEQVDRANLYVVMSTPEIVTAASGQSFGRTALTTGALALIVGLFLVFAWGAKLLPRAAVLAPQHVNRVSSSGMNSGPVSSSSYSGLDENRRPNAARMGTPGMKNDPLEFPTDPNARYQTPLGERSSNPAKANDVGSQASADRVAFIGRLVSGLERGMKEPLLAAMAHVQLVKVKSGDAPSAEVMSEIADHVTAVDRDLRRAKEIIDELSQISSQAATPGADERVDLNRVVTSVVDQQRTALEDDGINLKVDANSVPLVRGREEPVRKVLNELLKNARRALKNRGNKTITFKLSDEGDVNQISIGDNGVGMDRDTRQQAFDPFFFAFDETDARGLGLASVRAIIQSQGGTCEINSSPGDGTTVLLKWPVLASERDAFENKPVKVQATEGFESTRGTSTETIQGSTVDFAQEGANALGGKVPLGSDIASSLPPAPRFGADDDDDDKWSFQSDDKAALGTPAEVSSASMGGAASDGDKTQVDSTTEKTEVIGDPNSTVKIRPVRRG